MFTGRNPIYGSMHGMNMTQPGQQIENEFEYVCTLCGAIFDSAPGVYIHYEKHLLREKARRQLALNIQWSLGARVCRRQRHNLYPVAPYGYHSRLSTVNGRPNFYPVVRSADHHLLMVRGMPVENRDDFASPNILTRQYLNQLDRPSTDRRLSMVHGMPVENRDDFVSPNILTRHYLNQLDRPIEESIEGENGNDQGGSIGLDLTLGLGNQS